MDLVLLEQNGGGWLKIRWEEVFVEGQVDGKLSVPSTTKVAHGGVFC